MVVRLQRGGRRPSLQVDDGICRLRAPPHVGRRSGVSRPQYRKGRKSTAVPGPIAQYVVDAFKQREEAFPVFSMKRLAENPGFTSVSLM